MESFDCTQALEFDNFDDQLRTLRIPSSFKKPPEKVAFLVPSIKDGEKTYPLYEGENVVGRGLSCGVRIDNKVLSKRHAIIEADKGHCFVQDQNSLNGTYKGKVRLKPHVMYNVEIGEMLMFGNIGFNLKLQEEETLECSPAVSPTQVCSDPRFDFNENDRNDVQDQAEHSEASTLVNSSKSCDSVQDRIGKTWNSESTNTTECSTNSLEGKAPTNDTSNHKNDEEKLAVKNVSEQSSGDETDSDIENSTCRKVLQNSSKEKSKAASSGDDETASENEIEDQKVVPKIIEENETENTKTIICPMETQDMLDDELPDLDPADEESLLLEANDTSGTCRTKCAKCNRDTTADHMCLENDSLTEENSDNEDRSIFLQPTQAFTKELLAAKEVGTFTKIEGVTKSSENNKSTDSMSSRTDANDKNYSEDDDLMLAATQAYTDDIFVKPKPLNVKNLLPSSGDSVDPNAFTQPCLSLDDFEEDDSFDCEEGEVDPECETQPLSSKNSSLKGLESRNNSTNLNDKSNDEESDKGDDSFMLLATQPLSEDILTDLKSKKTKLPLTETEKDDDSFMLLETQPLAQTKLPDLKRNKLKRPTEETENKDDSSMFLETQPLAGNKASFLNQNKSEKRNDFLFAETQPMGARKSVISENDSDNDTTESANWMNAETQKIGGDVSGRKVVNRLSRGKRLSEGDKRNSFLLAETQPLALGKSGLKSDSESEVTEGEEWMNAETQKTDEEPSVKKNTKQNAKRQKQETIEKRNSFLLAETQPMGISKTVVSDSESDEFDGDADWNLETQKLGASVVQKSVSGVTNSEHESTPKGGFLFDESFCGNTSKGSDILCMDSQPNSRDETPKSFGRKRHSEISSVVETPSDISFQSINRSTNNMPIVEASPILKSKDQIAKDGSISLEENSEFADADTDSTVKNTEPDITEMEPLSSGGAERGSMNNEEKATDKSVVSTNENVKSSATPETSTVEDETVQNIVSDDITHDDDDDSVSKKGRKSKLGRRQAKETEISVSESSLGSKSDLQDNNSTHDDNNDDNVNTKGQKSKLGKRKAKKSEISSISESSLGSKSSLQDPSTTQSRSSRRTAKPNSKNTKKACSNLDELPEKDDMSSNENSTLESVKPSNDTSQENSSVDSALSVKSRASSRVRRLPARLRDDLEDDNSSDSIISLRKVKSPSLTSSTLADDSESVNNESNKSLPVSKRKGRGKQTKKNKDESSLDENTASTNESHSIAHPSSNISDSIDSVDDKPSSSKQKITRSSVLAKSNSDEDDTRDLPDLIEHSETKKKTNVKKDKKGKKEENDLEDVDHITDSGFVRLLSDIERFDSRDTQRGIEDSTITSVSDTDGLSKNNINIEESSTDQVKNTIKRSKRVRTAKGSDNAEDGIEHKTSKNINKGCKLETSKAGRKKLNVSEQKDDLCVSKTDLDEKGQTETTKSSEEIVERSVPKKRGRPARAKTNEPESAKLDKTDSTTTSHEASVEIAVVPKKRGRKANNLLSDSDRTSSSTLEDSEPLKETPEKRGENQIVQETKETSCRSTPKKSNAFTKRKLNVASTSKSDLPEDNDSSVSKSHKRNQKSELNSPAKPESPAKFVAPVRIGRKRPTSEDSGNTTTRRSRRTADDSSSERHSSTSSSSSPQSSGRKAKVQKVTTAVLFTGISDPDAEQVITQLGGTIVTDISKCSHLCTDKFRRTVKFLCCVGKGIPIVGMDWIKACKQKNTLVDSEDYILHDKEAEKTYSFKLSETLRNASYSPLFSNWSIFVTPSVVPGPEPMKEIIQYAGGKFLSKSPNRFMDQILIVSAEGDNKLAQRFVKMGFPVVTNEFVLTGLVRHKIDFKEFSLPLDK